MQTLATTLELKGIGSTTIATQVKRDGDLTMYKRDDEVYEVFFVKKAEAKEIFNKQYEAREIYPNNEDFGTIAWCFKTEASANKKYAVLLKRQNDEPKK